MLRDPVDILFYLDAFEYLRGHALRDAAAGDLVLAVAEDHRQDA